MISFILAGGSQILSRSRPTALPILDSSLQEATQNLVQSANQMSSSPQTLGQQVVIATITTLGAFTVYLFGQIFTKFFIEPIHEQKKIIGEIADALIFYANKYFSVYEAYYDPLTVSGSTEESKFRRRQAEKQADRNSLMVDRIRGLGTQLISKTYLIPLYGLFVRLHIVKPMNKISKAQRALIGLSNCVGSPEHDDRLKFESEIREALGLFDPNK